MGWSPMGFPNLQCGEITLSTGMDCACGGANPKAGTEPISRLRVHALTVTVTQCGRKEQLDAWGRRHRVQFFFVLPLLASFHFARPLALHAVSTWRYPRSWPVRTAGPVYLQGNVAPLPHLEANVPGVSPSSPRRALAGCPLRSSAFRNVTTSARNPREPRVTATEGATRPQTEGGEWARPSREQGGGFPCQSRPPLERSSSPVERGIGGLEKVRCSGGGSPPSPDRGTYLFGLGPTTRRSLAF